MPDNPSLLYYTPEAARSGTLPVYWSSTWNLPLYAETTRSSDPPNPLLAVFEAQWTDEHYQGNPGRNDVLQTWENDFRTTLLSEGNPLEDMERCGRGLRAPHSRYGIQVVPRNIDVLQLNFKAFPFSEDLKNTFFAVKLYGAEWVHPWDDTPGLCQRSLPNNWVLRRKTSPVALNHIRLKSPESHVFAIAIQGPGINADDTSQYGSLISLYYVPKIGQALSPIDQHRSLLKEVLPGKLDAMRGCISSEDDWHWGPLVSSLKPPVQATSSAKSGKATRVPDVSPTRLKPWRPRREIPSRGETKGITCFSDTPVRQSWLYQHSQDISNRPFLEAVYVHAYDNFSAYLRLFLLANLLWDEKAKGEALRQKCLEYFNANALPQELQAFLFNPDAPFAKLRFQINIQTFILGNERIQCLRPHYAVANIPFPPTYPYTLMNKCFLMKLYGAEFRDGRNEGASDISVAPSAGFSSKGVHTHEGPNGGRYWRASPNNCQIAGTDNHSISRSFYSVVMGKCMQYCDDYRDARPWDDEVAAIVTLHIIVEDNDPKRSGADIVRNNRAGSLSEIAKKCHDAWEIKHQPNAAKTKNPFQEFHNLFEKVDDDATHPAAPLVGGASPPPRPAVRPVVTTRPVVIVAPRKQPS